MIMPFFRASDGLELHYLMDDFTDPWRPPETLLLLHAAMGSSRRFYAWVPYLAREFRVVRLDMRGHGRSQIPKADQLNLDRLSQDAVDLLDHLGVDRVHLAGSSAGGIVSIKTAVDHSQRLRSLALFATLPGLAPAKGVDFSSWVTAIKEKGIRRFLTDTIAQRFDTKQVEPGFVEWFLDEAVKNDPELLSRFVPMMARVDLSNRLADIGCPTLAVCPDRDPIHSLDEYQAMCQGIADVRLVVYDGLPHNITDAVPDRCAAELLRFLRERRVKGEIAR
jgi:pimeloyl-ACP methyl ester carboxylesterase